MMERLVLFLLIFFWFGAKAQIKPAGEGCLGLSAFIPGPGDVSSFSVDPAALGTIDHFSAGLYSEKLFLINEINTVLVNVALPVHNGGFAFNAMYSGTVGFAENFLTLSYGRKLNSKIDAGVSFNYNAVAIEGYGRNSLLSYKTAAFFHLNPKFHCALIIGNLNSGMNEADVKWLPTVSTIGFAYIVSPLCFLSFKVEKQNSLPAIITGGIHYAFDKKLFVRAGFISGFPGFYFGSGIGWKQLDLLFLATIHNQLGLTPGLQLLVHGKNKS
jgi:hypothetical protein